MAFFAADFVADLGAASRKLTVDLTNADAVKPWWQKALAFVLTVVVVIVIMVAVTVLTAGVGTGPMAILIMAGVGAVACAVTTVVYRRVPSTVAMTDDPSGPYRRFLTTPRRWYRAPRSSVVAPNISRRTGRVRASIHAGGRSSISTALTPDSSVSALRAG